MNSSYKSLTILVVVVLFSGDEAVWGAVPVPIAGATVPWISYKAEQGVTTGEKLTSRTYGEIANEALNHTCVKLAVTGQHVTWKVRSPANAMVIRASVPDAPQGGGASHTLTVAVNGKARQKVTLSSLHSWLYGKDPNGNDNAPSTGTPHAYFDETREFLTGPPLKTGDTITLYKQAADTAPWYVIDLLDLELVAPPLQKPDGSLSATDYGAVPDDGKDDAAAFAACMDKARTEGKAMWVPAGTFHQTQPMELDRVKVRGAGLWHTHLVGLGELKPNYFSGNVGFKLSGSDVEVSGFSVDGSLTARSINAIQHGISGSANRFRVEDIWVRHTTTGAWIGLCSYGVVRRCRFRDTYADGLNINNHADTTTDMCLGGSAQKTGWADAIPGHSGHGEFHGSPPYESYRCAVKYRHMENLWGNLWCYIDGVNLANGQAFVCDDMTAYESGVTTGAYRPVALNPLLQDDNGDIGGVREIHFLKNLGYDPQQPWLALPVDYTHQGLSESHGKSMPLRNGHFGDYYYLNTKATCYVHGGGFDHYWRCGLFTLRGWATDKQKWYLYGSRLIFKPLAPSKPGN